MNPFEVHSGGHQMLQAILAEPIRGQTGGNIVYKNATYPARVSCFNIRQILVRGGFNSALEGTAIVSKSDLPDGIDFRAGQAVTAVAPGGQVRLCEVYMVDDEVTEFKITLWDKDAGT